MLVCDTEDFGVVAVWFEGAQGYQRQSIDLALEFRLAWPHERDILKEWVPKMNVNVTSLATLGPAGLQPVDRLTVDGWLQVDRLSAAEG